MATHSHDSVIVRKPWGYEYLAYQNEKVGLWVLHIAKGEKTSLHCHPEKTTGLVVVRGTVEINFIADSKKLVAPAKQMIRRGLFHQTIAISDDVILFEFETPVDKNDLVRLRDAYGREKIAYEGVQHELPKTTSCLWIENGFDIREYRFADCCLTVEKAQKDTLALKKPTDIIVFLRGGLIKHVDGRTHEVTKPGDIGFMSVVQCVAAEMDGFAEGTFIMTIRH